MYVGPVPTLSGRPDLWAKNWHPD